MQQTGFQTPWVRKVFKAIGICFAIVIVFVIMVTLNTKDTPPETKAAAIVEPTPEVNPYIESNPPMSGAVTSHQRFLYRFVDLKYGGECLPVKHKIRYSLNDPHSYEHIKTDLHMNEKTCVETVKTTIRGKNSFGALVVASYVATVDTNGNILTLKQQ